MRYLKVVMLLIMSLSLSYGQTAQFENKDKKELRKEKKAKRVAKVEESKAQVLKALNEGDFTMRANVFVNSQNRAQPLSDVNNFMMIDGDNIIIQNNAEIGLTNSNTTNLNIRGKISKIEINDSGEGKPLEATLFVRSQDLIGVLIVYVRATGDHLESRMIFGRNRFKMRGFFERTSETDLQVYPYQFPRIGQ